LWLRRARPAHTSGTPKGAASTSMLFSCREHYTAQGSRASLRTAKLTHLCVGEISRLHLLTPKRPTRGDHQKINEYNRLLSPVIIEGRFWMKRSNSWESILESPQCREVSERVDALRKKGDIYPIQKDVFRAFKDCPFE